MGNQMPQLLWHNPPRLGDVHSPGLYGEPLVFAPGSPAGQTRVDHYDGTGSLSEMTDATETGTDELRYRAFGETIHWTNSMGGGTNYETHGGQTEYSRQRNSPGLNHRNAGFPILILS
jgi:hypothetical protein